MLFNSISFLIFLPIVAFLYFLSGRFVRSNWSSQLILLVASLYFYMSWNPAYIILILLSVAITWASGLLMEGANAYKKRIILLASLASNLGILFFFKYYGFFKSTIEMLFGSLLPELCLPNFNVLLPVGISFYTFQALSYSIDVYRGIISAERNFLTYALFVTFFPQLVAGPIERSAHLLPQFKADYNVDYNRITEGLRLAAWGMFKKVAVADQLASYVNLVYSNLTDFSGVAIALATFFFAFQIYCDFSGYSDIAVGVARVLGFDIMTNFRQPYFSISIREFWQRWHISLSTWFRDYVYIPLGGNRTSSLRHSMNLIITFLVSGLWHGAAWNFVAWGALHGIYQLMGTRTYKWRDAAWNVVGFTANTPARRAIQILTTFLLVCIGWVFFRADSLRSSGFALRQIFLAPKELIWSLNTLLTQGSFIGFSSLDMSVGLDAWKFGWCVIAVTICLIADYLHIHKPWKDRVLNWPWALRWAGYYLMTMTMVVMALLSSNDVAGFIYFQF